MYDEDLFQEFLDERVQRHGKKINTERSVKMARNKLDEWGKIGYDCNAIISHAIEMGWRGLFLPKGFTPKQKPLEARGRMKDIAKSCYKKPPPPVDEAARMREIEEMKRRLGV